MKIIAFLSAAFALRALFAGYVVIDVGEGPNAARYPVSRLSAMPRGGWGEEFKTNRIVLREIDGKPFAVGVFEVTQRQYELVTGKNPSGSKSPAHPVECVSYDDLAFPGSFISLLREKSALAVDLPTEAQWEFACRAGTLGQYNCGDGVESLAKAGRYAGNASDDSAARLFHAEVGSYLPNAFGLYDMHGNVFEWCRDVYDVYDRSRSGRERRVLRGGSWYSNATGCTSSSRHCRERDVADIFYGFRIVVNTQTPN